MLFFGQEAADVPVDPFGAREVFEIRPGRPLGDLVAVAVGVKVQALVTANGLEPVGGNIDFDGDPDAFISVESDWGGKEVILPSAITDALAEVEAAVELGGAGSAIVGPLGKDHYAGCAGNFLHPEADPFDVTATESLGFAGGEVGGEGVLTGIIEGGGEVSAVVIQAVGNGIVIITTRGPAEKTDAKEKKEG